ncbi:MAG: GntR family transcriptional regulator, partial [Nocardioidaceae bacterium]
MDQSGVHALTLRVDRSRRTRLPAQLAEQIRERIRSGELREGARLPSSRAVAEGIGVSRAVAGAAYEQLVAEGWLAARRGSGTFVRRVDVPDSPATAVARVAHRQPATTISLRAGEPWTPRRPSP